MRRTDRLLGIMLKLRAGRVVTASELASAFEVSQRTIYRDIETLSSLGVPVYAEQGRHGGYRLLDGYFLPAISFSQEEAISLLLGLTVLARMRSRPFAAHLETARTKLLAAIPAHLSSRLEHANHYLGVESSAEDPFHRELTEPGLPHPATAIEQQAIDTFLLALLDGMTVTMTYRSPFRASDDDVVAVPHGLFWDRDRWYLVGDRLDPTPGRRLWRADRVQAIRPLDRQPAKDSSFDIQQLLGRRWLAGAMAQWAMEAPVRIRVSQQQASLLRQDWYYSHARFETCPDDSIIVQFGQDQASVVMELVRWLGPGAELLEPPAWRARLTDELREMLDMYQADVQASQ